MFLEIIEFELCCSLKIDWLYCVCKVQWSDRMCENRLTLLYCTIIWPYLWKSTDRGLWKSTDPAVYCTMIWPYPWKSTDPTVYCTMIWLYLWKSTDPTVLCIMIWPYVWKSTDPIVLHNDLTVSVKTTDRGLWKSTDPAVYLQWSDRICENRLTL